MGCSSVRLGTKGKVIHLASGFYYLVKNCYFMLGCLWDVGDIDIDRITKKILEVLLVRDRFEGLWIGEKRSKFDSISKRSKERMQIEISCGLFRG